MPFVMRRAKKSTFYVDRPEPEGHRMSEDSGIEDEVDARTGRIDEALERKIYLALSDVLRSSLFDTPTFQALAASLREVGVDLDGALMEGAEAGRSEDSESAVTVVEVEDEPRGLLWNRIVEEFLVRRLGLGYADPRETHDPSRETRATTDHLLVQVTSVPPVASVAPNGPTGTKCCVALGEANHCLAPGETAYFAVKDVAQERIRVTEVAPDVPQGNGRAHDSPQRYGRKAVDFLANLSPSKLLAKRSEECPAQQSLDVSRIDWSDATHNNPVAFKTNRLNVRFFLGPPDLVTRVHDHRRSPPPHLFTQSDLDALMLLVYAKELDELRRGGPPRSPWHGKLPPVCGVALHCLRLASDHRAFEEARAKALLTFRKEISSHHLKDRLQFVPPDLKLLQTYKEECLEVLASYDRRNQTREAPVEPVIENLVEIYSIVNPLGETLTSELGVKLEHSMGTFFSSVKRQTCPDDTLESLVAVLRDFVTPTHKDIVERFENFGALSWGPTFDACAFQEAMRVIHPLVKDMQGIFENMDDHVDSLTKVFNLYRQMRLNFSSQNLDDFYELFGPFLPVWANCTASVAKERVQRALRSEREMHPTVKDSSRLLRFLPRKVDSVNLELSLEKRMSDPSGEWLYVPKALNETLQSCNETWKNLQWPQSDISINNFGLVLMAKLFDVFMIFLDGLKIIVQTDGIFTKHELVFVLNWCFILQAFHHCFQETFDLLFAKCNREDMKDAAEQFKNICDKIDEEPKMFITLFCEEQTEIISNLISARILSRQSNELFTYLDDLLLLLKPNPELHLDDQIQRLAQHYFDCFKKQLFGMIEKNLTSRISSKKLTSSDSAFEILEDLVEKISMIQEVKNIFPSPEILAVLEVKKMETDQLMKMFLTKSIQEQERLLVYGEEDLGQVTFQAGILGNEIVVQLLNVRSLKPRPNKKEVNFQLKISLMYLCLKDGNLNVSQETKVYRDQTHHLFDLDEGSSSRSKKSRYVFELPQTVEMGFLDIAFFDTLVFGSTFRGSCTLPLSGLSKMSTLDELPSCEMTKFFCGLSKLSIDKVVLDELQLRKDSKAKEFMKLQESRFKPND